GIRLFHVTGVQTCALPISQGNTFTLDGTIGTEQITIPNFDLAVKADHFKILEATEEENELFFGDVSLSTALNITGDLEIPIVREIGSAACRECGNYGVCAV